MSQHHPAVLSVFELGTRTAALRIVAPDGSSCPRCLIARSVAVGAEMLRRAGRPVDAGMLERNRARLLRYYGGGK